MRPAAVIFDFNGTISDDEPLLAELCTLIFGEIGIEVTEERYFSEFAGYSDPEIVERVLAGAGRPEPAVAQGLLDRRTELYLARAGTGETVHPPVAHAYARSLTVCRSRSPPAPSARRSRPCSRAAACFRSGGVVTADDVAREAGPGGLPDRARPWASAVPTLSFEDTTSASWRRSPPGCGASAWAPRPTGFSRCRGRGGRGRP
jgi:beta-phosphoglucomutase-like phosphatase (HAD superfamily)